MIMHTFAEAFDWVGKTVYPFTTFALSGFGTAESDYAGACRGAAIGEGLAVQGEKAQHAASAVAAWLDRIGI